MGNMLQCETKTKEQYYYLAEMEFKEGNHHGARKFYEAAANKGHIGAAYRLATEYHDYDYEQERTYLKKVAASNEDPWRKLAIYKLIDLRHKNPIDEMFYLDKLHTLFPRDVQIKHSQQLLTLLCDTRNIYVSEYQHFLTRPYISAFCFAPDQDKQKLKKIFRILLILNKLTRTMVESFASIISTKELNNDEKERLYEAQLYNVLIIHQPPVVSQSPRIDLPVES